ncbi:DMT family transporter [Anaerotignum sp.]|uniref:DMT family transporter n=1 Tax=Anaerotignum sp. TaxID=2039241 RepID=UPI0028ACE87E|nr:DMT family transporter [Anaerotignum sp.]
MNLNDTEMSVVNSSGKGQAKGIILAVTAAIMWGIMGIFVRGLGEVGYTSYDISFLRCALAGVAFFLFTMATNPKVLKIDLKGAIVCFFYGVFAYAIGFVAYGISVERIPVAVATVLMFMSPIWVALLGVLVFKERLKKETIGTIIICIVGASLVANVFASNGNLDPLGIFMGLLNGFGVALQIMIPRYFAKKYERDTMLVYGFLGAAVALAFLTDFSTIATSLSSEAALTNIMNLLGIGILCTMVANVSFVKATLYINTTTCSILSALEVVVGAAVGLLLYNENMTALQVLGAIIVVIGSLGPTIFKRRHKTVPAKESINA